MKYEVIELEIDYNKPIDLPIGCILIKCEHKFHTYEYEKGSPTVHYWDLHYLKPLFEKEDSG